MKTNFFMTLAIVLTCACSSLQAQQQGRGGRDILNENMIKELKLTDQQVTNIKKADADLKTQMQTLRDNKSLSKKEIKEAMDKMREDRKAILKNNLTTEQYITYLEQQIERLQKMNMENRSKNFESRERAPRNFDNPEPANP